MTIGVSSKASFGRKAGSYEAHARVQRDAADWLAGWLPEKRERASCLEFGSGTGLFTRHLADRFALIEASDVEESMLEECRRRVAGVRCRVRDAWQPQPDEGQWELITSSSLMQWACDPVETLKQWRKMLTPGGQILVGLFAVPSLPEMAAVLPGGGPITWRTPSAWSDLMEEAGLQVLKVESVTQRYEYGSALDLWKSLHGTGAVVSRKIPPSVMRQMFQEYEAQFGAEAGVYATWTFCRILAER